MVDPFIPMRGTPGNRGRGEAAVALVHGFGCAQQMQGQMHVHAAEITLRVPLLGHFFRHPNFLRRQWYRPMEGRNGSALSVSVTVRVLLEVF
ncbi:hypothetical protein ACFWN1_00835 [Streptomyces sp. NPDC058459]|uniref:hypothetical protein n=1 Tax=Streptomyces sp. NPDC058459 TaxID=3346508 RepID=UPI003664A269